MESRKKLRSLFTIISMADSAAMDVFQALVSGISDFEDAVMVETAKRIGADCIVTRNTKDYAKATLPVCTPAEFLDTFFSSDEELE